MLVDFGVHVAVQLLYANRFDLLAFIDVCANWMIHILYFKKNSST